MKKSGIRKNNRGDSLILVIGCIALLSIVGVILLAKTIDNRNMKLAEEQAQASFFGAESGSAEMVTVIETVAHEAIEAAFADMLVEFSLLGNKDARDERFSEFFSKKVEEELSTTDFATQLKSALGVADLTNLEVDCSNVYIDTTVPAETGYTETVRVEGAEFSYTTAGSKTKITTDICIRARIPDVEHGFNSGISCDFADFAIISDKAATVSTNEDLNIKGNVYVGTDLVSDGTNVAMKIKGAKKLLVKNELKVGPGAQMWIDNGTLTFADGEGIWAGGISVKLGQLNTENVNVYVVDDLAVEGTVPAGNGETKVVMKGAGSKYVGFSGNTSAAINHEKSSAITINEVDNLTLDLSQLGNLYINGNSYICEDNSKWGNWDAGAIATAEGIMQGETIAYKDMQAMYLYPGSCLPQGHNPIIGEDITVGMASTMFSFQGPSGTETLDLSQYVDTDNPYVTRTAVLDGGATKATYVYLNFANAAKAAQYVQDYLATSKGISIKSQIVNMGSSTVKLPTQTITLGSAISYVGGNLTILPPATSLQLPTLSTSCLLAKQRYSGLFSTLRAEAGIHVGSDYKMVAKGIINKEGIEETLTLGETKSVTMTNPMALANTYNFYVHYGNLTIGTDVESEKYKNLNGILVVHGDLNIAATNTQIKGLVLATGNVNVTRGTTITADPTAVETLLTNDDVAKYFRVYGDTTGNGYLSTESVEISFENWKKN